MNCESSHDSPSREPFTHGVDSESRATKTHEVDSESRTTVIWNMFDPEADVDVSARNRPHWDQNGAATFLTIRLADSMPKAVVARWLAEQDDWLKAHGLDSESRAAKAGHDASSHDSPSRELSRHKLDSESRTTKTRKVDSESRATRGHGSESRDAALAGAPRHLLRAFHKFKNQRWHENLDNCHGNCLLRDKRFANIVTESLLAFDGSRYDVERFVIMPNHVHLLVQMRPGWRLREQCESWTRFTGRQINALNQTSGQFWSEPFDHVVRNEAQFQYLQEYIVDNPRKAKLAHGDYVLWIRGAGFIVARLSES